MIRLKPDRLDSLPPEPWVEYWLVFTEPEKPHWWSRFLAPGFGHVYLLKQERGRWVRLNWGLDACILEVLSIPAYASLGELVKAGETAVRVRAGLGQRPRVPWVFGPLTCVELAKAVLGLRDIRILTPHQLYRRVRSGRV